MPDYTSQINDYLKKKGSPMAGLGHLFTGAGQKYGVDPRLVVAISGIESSFGKHTYGAHNAWGWGPGKAFGSWEEGISSVTQGLRQGYLNRGLKTPEQIVNRYAPASDGNNTGRWVNTVNQFLGEMGYTVPTKKQPEATYKDPGTVPVKTVSKQLPPGFDPMQNLRAAAMSNLASFASGKFVKPTEQLAALAGGAQLDHQAERAARLWGGTTIPNDPSTSTPTQGGNAAQTTPRANGKVAKAIEFAKAQIGKPYVFGAAGPKAFDCSGLIEWAFEQAGIKTPGRMTTGTAIRMGRDVTGMPMEPGDWLVRHDGQQQHMVMYVGNGQVIAAPHTGEVVQYQDADKFRGAGWRVRRYP